MAAITRAQFRDAIGDLLDAQMAATPDLLRKTARHDPGSIGSEKPVAWIGEITDDAEYNQGTRHRRMTVQGQLATTFPADAATDAFDDLCDALLERFTANYNVIANTVLRMVHVEPNEVSIPKADGSANVYRGMSCRWTLDIWENRI